MKNSNENGLNPIQVNNKTTMSSLEIAELSGKRHADVLKAIKVMEPAWQKASTQNFVLTHYEEVTGGGGKKKYPKYELTKRECLYVATKFNDEARARLIIRWDELEQKQFRQAAQQNQIPEQGTYIENQIFRNKLGGDTILGYYTNGTLYFAMSGVMRFVGFMSSGGKQYAERFNGAIKIQDGKHEKWFVSIDWIDELLGSTTLNVAPQDISTLYRDLFNIKKYGLKEAPFAYMFTYKEMVDILFALNKKPVNKGDVIEMLKKGEKEGV